MIDGQAFALLARQLLSHVNPEKSEKPIQINTLLSHGR